MKASDRVQRFGSYIVVLLAFAHTCVYEIQARKEIRAFQTNRTPPSPSPRSRPPTPRSYRQWQRTQSSNYRYPMYRMRMRHRGGPVGRRTRWTSTWSGMFGLTLKLFVSCTRHEMNEQHAEDLRLCAWPTAALARRRLQAIEGTRAYFRGSAEGCERKERHS